jgi:hypothetical protein
MPSAMLLTAVENLRPGTVEVTAHLEPFGIGDERLDDRVNETVVGQRRSDPTYDNVEGCAEPVGELRNGQSVISQAEDPT